MVTDNTDTSKVVFKDCLRMISFEYFLNLHGAEYL